MPITRNLQGVGTGAAQSRAIVGVMDRNKTATGTTRADAYLLSEDVTLFNVVPANTGAALRSDSQENDVYTVVNNGANALKVYPPVGGNIDGAGVNVAYSLAAGSFADFQALGDNIFIVREQGDEKVLAALAAPTGAGLIGWIASGVGAILRSVQDKLRDIISRSDYDTLANMWAASILKPKIDPTTGKAWFNTDSSALDYSTSRAGFVWQHRDAAAGSANTLIPGAVMQFNSTGNGDVNSGSELSTTIWQGLYTFHRKTGDGSAHCFTGIGELGSVGPGGYNELGGCQGELTNTGSVLGTMSGLEWLLKDSPDGGGTTYSTRMEPFVSRIAKYNPTTRKSTHFLASSEGTLPPNAILGGKTTGLAQWQRGFDFQGLTFTSGQYGLIPNNTALGALDAGGTARVIFGISNTNQTYMRAASAAAIWGIQNFAGSAFNIALQDNGHLGINTGISDQSIMLKVHDSSATGVDITGLENTSTANNTTKFTGFRLRGRDTANSGKDTLYIRAHPLDGDYVGSYAEVSVRAADAMVSVVQYRTTGVVLKATTTNDSAAAGKIGEFITSTVAVGSAVSLTNATGANVTSISLTAGDWDVSAQVDFVLTGATSTSHQSGISLTSATLPSQAGGSGLGTDALAVLPMPTSGLSGTLTQPIPPVRISLTATTTVYLVAQAAFSVGSEAAYGTIRARRPR